MFKKIKVKIREKLKLYLDISDLKQELTDYKNKNDKNIFNHERNLEWCSEQISQFDSKVEAIHNTVKNVVHIGTDVRCNDYHSWAVVCIEGKINIVKFVPLNGKDARYILDFLKQFEAGRHCIDTPCKEMFYENLWKF